MSDWSVWYKYNRADDLVALVVELQLSDLDADEKVRALRDWAGRVGVEVESWMEEAVKGPVYLGSPEPVVEVISV